VRSKKENKSISLEDIASENKFITITTKITSKTLTQSRRKDSKKRRCEENRKKA
jgi:hypothetical protein